MGRSSFYQDQYCKCIRLGVPYLYAVAIIRNLKQLQPPVLDDHFKGGGASIHGVLDEFFEGVYRSHDNLTSGNLVHDIGVEGLWQASAPSYDPRVGRSGGGEP